MAGKFFVKLASLSVNPTKTNPFLHSVRVGYAGQAGVFMRIEKPNLFFILMILAKPYINARLLLYGDKKFP